MRDITNVSREGRRLTRFVIRHYVATFICDEDRERLERELLGIMSAERSLAIRCVKRARRSS